jgi:hypothetical protein
MNAQPNPPAAPVSIEDLERLLRHHLEELHFSFGDEPLVDLAGLLICEGDCRAIITAADLDPAARLFCYLHCLGHLALGHVDPRRLTLTYEFRDRWRLPPHLQARETAADQWALGLLDAAHGASSELTTPSRYPLRPALRNLRIPCGFLRACLTRLRAGLQATSPETVRCLRQQAATAEAGDAHAA